MKLRNKKILISAGPTWIPIDKVRVISNIATGETGILLAKKFLGIGAKVTLLLGLTSSLRGEIGRYRHCEEPQATKQSHMLDCFSPLRGLRNDSSFTLLRFRFFDELKDIILRELKAKKYDIVIHSAAVSDYRPAKMYNRKIPSGIKRLKFELVPTLKIINLIKNIAPGVFLVGFKFEPGATRGKLLRGTKNLIRAANLDLAVANTINAKRYSAYILNNGIIYGPLRNKKDMVNGLIHILREKECKN